MMRDQPFRDLDGRIGTTMNRDDRDQPIDWTRLEQTGVADCWFELSINGEAVEQTKKEGDIWAFGSCSAYGWIL